MEGAIMREEEPAVRFMNRCKKIYESWIVPSHRSGNNHHNVSATVTYRENEKEYVKKWMWNNRHSYTGMSLLPLDLGTYIQAPFETISKEKYEELLAKFPPINLSEVFYGQNQKDERQGEVACAGGSCEIT
jgi:ribonucleoside-diphosphate reductase alpha chain